MGRRQAARCCVRHCQVTNTATIFILADTNAGGSNLTAPGVASIRVYSIRYRQKCWLKRKRLDYIIAVMSWAQFILPAAIGAVGSFLIAFVTLRFQRKKELRELNSKFETDLKEWKLRFAELSAKDRAAAHAAAQQVAIGLLAVNSGHSDPDDHYVSREKVFVPKDVMITIGGSSDAFVHVEGDGISRTHAIINSRGDRVFIQDVSTIGTRVNGTVLVEDEVELLDGDKILVGSTEILFVALHSPSSRVAEK